MSQRYNNNIKRPRLLDTKLGILKIYMFAGKVNRGPLAEERVLLALHSVHPSFLLGEGD